MSGNDYFNYQRNRAPDDNRRNAPLPAVPPQTPGAQTPGGRQLAGANSLEGLRAPSSIRIRRLPSGLSTPRPSTQQGGAPVTVQAGPTTTTTTTTTTTSGRRRSSSEPQRYGQTLAPPATDLSRQRTYDMPTITEGQTPTPGPQASESSQDYQDALETPRPRSPSINIDDTTTPAGRVMTGASAMNEAGNAARANRGLQRFRTGGSAMPRNENPGANEYRSDVVDLLDLVDREVSTLGTLTNVQNSLFVPDLGGLINRRPTYNLTTRPSSTAGRRSRAGTGAARPPSGLPTIPSGVSQDDKAGDIEMQEPLGRRFSISSNLSDSRYAVLPHGIDLDEWTEDDKAELDDHVRHLLHSRREGFKRSMRGFRQYISKPLGLFVTLYATLITLFGAAWVFFLIGWIYVGPKQDYIINIVDNVLVALFALMGDGLAPFRMVDTYHMCFIATYHHKTWRLRKERALPDLVDHNDLPDRRASTVDVDDAIDKEETAEYSVLKLSEQRRLQYHQAKFSKAHTFYRPHETATHHAFPLRLLVAVVVMLDFHSIFQVILGTCTWSWDYHTRPSALTATILSCSITCNITAGILISVGDHRTRKKDVLERIARQQLTQEALGRMAEERKQEPHIGRKSLEASRAQMEKEQREEEERQHEMAGPSASKETR